MKKIREFDGLLRSEVKKAESLANKIAGRKDCKVTGWSAHRDPADPLLPEFTWWTVTCEICFDYVERAPFDIQVHVFMNDRRRSFTAVTDNH